MGEFSFGTGHLEHFQSQQRLLEALREKKADWTAFIENRIIRQTVDPVVAQSWIRSKSAGIDPYHLNPTHLSEAELQALRKKNEILLQYTRPLIQKIFETSGGHITLVSIHDKEGYLLELSELDPENMWHDACFRPGVRWQESDVGTNALGLVLVTKEAFQLVGAEHYYAAHDHLCCCAAPITDHRNEIAGVLNVCARVDDFSEYMMPLTQISSHAISGHLKAYHSFEADQMVFTFIPKSIILLDNAQKITRCSASAARIFHTQASDLLGNQIQDVIHIPGLSRQFASEENETVCYHECGYYFDSRLSFFDVTATPIHKQGKRIGMLLDIKDSARAAQEVADIVGKAPDRSCQEPAFGSAVLHRLLEQARQLPPDEPLLLCGESGTEKELLAQAIHLHSSRSGGLLVAIDCGMTPASLLECELFGCESASSGASHLGKLELANGGTLLLRHAERLPPELQRRLLHALKTARVRRVGGKVERTAKVRVIASTGSDRISALQYPAFRENLFALFDSTAVLEIPPLRERLEDIALYAQETAARLNRQEHMSKTLAPSFLELLQKQPWPENLRELQAAVAQAYYSCPDQAVSPELLLPARQGDGRPGEVDSGARSAILQTLSSCQFDVSRAAASMGISKATMYRRMKKYGIQPREIR